MPDVTLTINGTPVTVPAGTNIVDAARTVQIAVPVFCYHPKLQPVGMCRMCLVQIGTPKLDQATRQPVRDEQGKFVIQMQPKLVTGCTTPVSEGMVVVTTSSEVAYAQRGILEFLLTSHPLDCPVCDKGGECPLQNLTMGWGPGNSRFDYRDKVHFEKPIPLGNLIYLDRERCILCARCVRFEDELADDHVLGFDHRGRSWEIISKSDPPFDSKFSGNTTDICPVGALTSADFRFKARVWELSPVPSVCPHCPVGCNLTLDMRFNSLMRVMPRENDAVNEIWICDKGRFGMRFCEDQGRLTTPLLRRGDALVPVGWDEALSFVAEKLMAIKQNRGGQALGGLAGDRLANEDLYAFQRLMREVLGSPHLDHRVRMPGEPVDDDLAGTLGVGVGTDLSKLGQGATALVFGADPEEEAPLYMLRLRAIAQRGGTLIVANARATKLDRSASQQLQVKPGYEAHLAWALVQVALEEKLGDTRLLGRVRNLDRIRELAGRHSPAAVASASGVTEEAIRAAARAFASAEHGIIVYGREALQCGPALTGALAALAAITGKAGRANSGLIALLAHGNSRGALDMGVRPDATPGYTRPAQAGLPADAMLAAAAAGDLRGLIVAGVDPLGEQPQVAAALAALEVLVVADMFMTETAQRADVVLPLLTFSEYDGTFTNAERRVQRFRKARTGPREARALWQVSQLVARAVLDLAAQPVTAAPANLSRRERERQAAAASNAPAGWEYVTAGDVAAEVATRVPGYQGITHARLAATRSPGAMSVQITETSAPDQTFGFGRQSVVTGTAAGWSREMDEQVYYDGTSYENIEGVGLQWPAAAEDARAALGWMVAEAAPVHTDPQYPLTLLTPKLLYDGDAWLRGSLLRTGQVPPAHVLISVADAQRLGVQMGDHVRVESPAGSLELPARIGFGLVAGTVLIPASLPGAPLATLVTGPRTGVRLVRSGS